MPLSKCRICGKYVPNPYRPYHEKIACREMKRQKGLLLHEELPRPPRKFPDKPVNHPNQRKLFSFGVAHE